MKKPKDPISSYTHFGAMLTAIVVSPFVIYKGVIDNNLFPAIVYLLSLITLFAASSIYHFFKTDALKKFDHCSIFFLIAGSYTPFCLITLKGKTGTILLVIIWTLALLGTVFKLFFVHCPRFVSSIIYIAMGWAVIFTLPDLIRNLSSMAMFLLVTGGVVYTVGGIIYALKPKLFKHEAKTGFGNHELFHIFVNVAALFHLLCIGIFII
ncbi:MAG: hemolysin III family protein [Erysipelotrichaceae bacterium]|nr:hemolysin III family protein [Erysipelotrichaceae bacterium]